MFSLLGYPFNFWQILTYAVLAVSSYFLLKRSFSQTQAIFLTIVTIGSFEVLWEIPTTFNSLASYLVRFWDLHVLIICVTVKTLIGFIPVVLWFYYAVRFGKPAFLLLFVVTSIIEFASFTVAVWDPVWSFWVDFPILRMLWLGFTVLNITSWRAKE